MLLPSCKPIKHLLRYEEKGKISLVHPVFTLEQATNQPTITPQGNSQGMKVTMAAEVSKLGSAHQPHQTIPLPAFHKSNHLLLLT